MNVYVYILDILNKHQLINEYSLNNYKNKNIS